MSNTLSNSIGQLIGNQTQVVANTLAGERDHLQISFVNTGDPETTVVNGIVAVLSEMMRGPSDISFETAARVLLYLHRRYDDRGKEAQKQWELQASIQRAQQGIGQNPPPWVTSAGSSGMVPLSVGQIQSQAQALAASPNKYSSFLDAAAAFDPGIISSSPKHSKCCSKD